MSTSERDEAEASAVYAPRRCSASTSASGSGSEVKPNAMDEASDAE